jgi:hypothetical protein
MVISDGWIDYSLLIDIILTMLNFMDSVVPTGLVVFGARFPAMNHWANIISPYGTSGLNLTLSKQLSIKALRMVRRRLMF